MFEKTLRHDTKNGRSRVRSDLFCERGSQLDNRRHCLKPATFQKTINHGARSDTTATFVPQWPAGAAPRSGYKNPGGEIGPPDGSITFPKTPAPRMTPPVVPERKGGGWSEGQAVGWSKFKIDPSTRILKDPIPRSCALVEAGNDVEFLLEYSGRAAAGKFHWRYI